MLLLLTGMSHVTRLDVTYRLCSQASAYPTLTGPSPSPNSPFFTPFNALSVSKEYFQPLFRCSISRSLLPKVISGNGMPPKEFCNAVHWNALEMGFVRAVMDQSPSSIVREFGDSNSLCSGSWGTDVMVGREPADASDRS